MSTGLFDIPALAAQELPDEQLELVTGEQAEAEWSIIE